MYRTTLSFDPCTTEHGGQSMVFEVSLLPATYFDKLKGFEDLPIPILVCRKSAGLLSKLFLLIVSNAADKSLATLTGLEC